MKLPVKSKMISVSVGVAAYNEGANIGNLLSSILQQHEVGYKLVEIIVISDGSSDNTVRKVRKFNDARLRLISNKDRLGQTIRQNEILSIAKGTVIVLLEADTILVDDTYLAKLVAPFLQETNIGLVYGLSLPLPGETFFEQMMSFVDITKNKAFRTWNNGHNVYLCHSGKAYSRQLARRLIWPLDAPEDSYAYLFCRRLHFKVRQVPEAVVYYRSPANMADYFKKTIRFNRGKGTLVKYFSQKTLDLTFNLPISIVILIFGESLFMPFVYAYTFALVHLLSKIKLFLTPAFNALWEPSKSTKKFLPKQINFRLTRPMYYEN
jgi:glycosyltransferase involved in cell wall biosynthesis